MSTKGAATIDRRLERIADTVRAGAWPALPLLTDSRQTVGHGRAGLAGPAPRTTATAIEAHLISVFDAVCASRRVTHSRCIANTARAVSSEATLLTGIAPWALAAAAVHVGFGSVDGIVGT